MMKSTLLLLKEKLNVGLGPVLRADTMLGHGAAVTALDPVLPRIAWVMSCGHGSKKYGITGEHNNPFAWVKLAPHGVSIEAINEWLRSCGARMLSGKLTWVKHDPISLNEQVMAGMISGRPEYLVVACRPDRAEMSYGLTGYRDDPLSWWSDGVFRPDNAHNKWGPWHKTSWVWTPA